MNTITHWPGLYGRTGGAPPVGVPYQLEVFEYQGNGVNARQINLANSSLNPLYVCTGPRDGAANQRRWYRSMAENGSSVPWNVPGRSDGLVWSGNSSSRIQDQGLGYFTVGTSGDVNGNGVWYTGWAVAPVAGASNGYASAWYTGDGAGTRSITGVGFEPDIVWIGQRDSDNDYWYVRGAVDTIDLGIDRPGVVISSLDPDGFSLSGMNSSGTDYIWQCFKSTTGVCGHMYSHAGTGASGTVIAIDPGVTPDMVFHGDTENNVDTWFRTKWHGDNFSTKIRDGAGQAEYIQRFNAGSYEVGAGSDVNQVGNTYAGMWFKEAAE